MLLNFFESLIWTLWWRFVSTRYLMNRRIFHETKTNLSILAKTWDKFMEFNILWQLIYYHLQYMIAIHISFVYVFYIHQLLMQFRKWGQRFVPEIKFLSSRDIYRTEKTIITFSSLIKKCSNNQLFRYRSGSKPEIIHSEN